jgi:hypothetical protein
MANMYHEPVEELPQGDRDITRALQSLKEEIEAVDWYNQRAASSGNQELRNLLLHNRDEEIEHASMLIEWLRRLMPAWDNELRTYLFSSGPLDALEEGAAEGGDDAGAETERTPGGSGDLGIGGTSRSQ